MLLRLALLVLYNPPYEPLDVLLNYSHLNLQNDTFAAFLPEFRSRARIAQFLTASPLNMGLLTPSPPPWHPAPLELRDKVKAMSEQCIKEGWGVSLPNLALGFAYRRARELDVPTVVGLSNLKEVHETVRIWRGLQLEEGESAQKRVAGEKCVLLGLEKSRGYSWASP